MPESKRDRSTEMPMTSGAGISSEQAGFDRRRFLSISGLAASSLVAGATLSNVVGAQQSFAEGLEKASLRPGLDNHVTISSHRLNELVAQAYGLFNEKSALGPFDPIRHGARFDVELYRIMANTQIPETGETVKVSGLLALPSGAKGSIPAVSWQHGTILSFIQVPSNLTQIAEPGYVPSDAIDSLETLFNIQRFAGNGYAVIAADYLGKGPFRAGRSEAYAVKDATVRTCSDILNAGLEGLRSLGLERSQLFLNGWSQGALNTQWLRQELQRRGEPVAATAVQSPFNDLNESFRFWAGAQTFPNPSGAPFPSLPEWVSLCMIVVLGSYQQYYGLDGLFKSAIKPEYQAMAVKYWGDYAFDFDPTKPFPGPTNLLVDGFFERYTADVNSRFLRQLASNRATYWDYNAPIRFFYGLADEAIHPTMAKRPLGAGGRFADGVAVKGASHRATFLASLYGAGDVVGGQPDLLGWFNGFLRR
jgi:hypothetical protein